MHTSTKNQAKGDVVLTDTTLANFDNRASVFTQKIKRWIQQLSGGLVFGLSLSMLGVTPAMAGSFSFTKIADTQSEFTSLSNGAAINDSGTVAFVATPKNSSQALYTSDGVSNTEIINTNQLPALFGELTPPAELYSLGSSLNINNNGTVAIIGTQNGGSRGENNRILVAQGGSLTTRGSGGSDRFGGNTIQGFALNQQDEVAYLKTASGRTAGFMTNSILVLTRANQPDVTIASSASSPQADVPFSSINSFDINNQSEVTFAATTKQSPDTTAIFSGNGGEPTSIVETAASALNVNDKGNILLSNGDAIRLFDHSTGTLRTIADTNSGSFQTFSTPAINKQTFSAPAINNNDNVAFTATLNGGEKGIFTGADPVADKVIATGDSMFGSTVIDLNFLGRPGLNNLGQIAFYAKLANGEQAIYRAEPVAETPIEQPQPQVEDAFALSKIIDTLTPIPGHVGNFTAFDNLVINGDNVVFVGTLPDRISKGLYIKRGDTQIEVVADKNTPIPGGIGNFYPIFVDAPVINDGNVLFSGSAETTPSLVQQRGIYIKRGDTQIEVVADKDTPIPGGTGNFSGFSSYVLDKNNVAFLGTGAFEPNQQQGIYIKRGDTQIEVVADKNTPIPGGSGNFSNFNFGRGSLLLDENNVAFRGDGASGQGGIYISRDGTLQVVADTNTTIPGGSGNFSVFSSFLLHRNNVAFIGGNSYDNQGIYLSRNGRLQVVADRNTPIPGGSGNFTSLYGKILSIDGSNVVFLGFGADGQRGIYINRNGKIRVVVDANTNLPDTIGKFGDSNIFISDGEKVVFGAGTGIYASIGGSLLKVADLGSMVDGKRISSFLFSSPLLGIGNSLTFEASFPDGTTAIVRADLNPHSAP